MVPVDATFITLGNSACRKAPIKLPGMGDDKVETCYCELHS